MIKDQNVVDIEYLNAGYRYAFSLSENQQDSEDLVHDAWIRLDKRYGKCPDKPLLFRTIRNLFIDQYRRKRKVQFSDFDEVRYDPAFEGREPGGVESAFETAYMEAEALQLQLDRLRYVEREALYLSVVEGYTADEVAQMTSSSRGTVLSLMHRAKGKLRRWLTPDEATGSDEPDNNNTVVKLTPGRNRS